MSLMIHSNVPILKLGSDFHNGLRRVNAWITDQFFLFRDKHPLDRIIQENSISFLTSC